MKRLVAPLLMLATTLMGACEEFEDFPVPTCPLEPTLSASEASPDDELSLDGMEQTYLQDTRVLVGGVEADVTAVVRENCSDCDSCVELENCAFVTCDCPGCDDACSTCEQSLSFLVPALPDGSWQVVVINSIGTSTGAWLTITGSDILPPDTGDTGHTGDTATDTGTDTAPVDTGTSSTDTADTSSTAP